MMSQNRFIFSTRFLFVTLPQLNSDKSFFVISSAIKMKTQHDTKKKLIFGIDIENAEQKAVNCDSHASGYPSGVFQSNGYLN